MPLQTAIQHLDDAMRRLESRIDGRIRALEAEVAALRIERDMLIEQVQLAAGAPSTDAEAPADEIAALLDELDAMATAHDALIQRYGELELRHAELEQVAHGTLERVDDLIARVQQAGGN